MDQWNLNPRVSIYLFILPDLTLPLSVSPGDLTIKTRSGPRSSPHSINTHRSACSPIFYSQQYLPNIFHPESQYRCNLHYQPTLDFESCTVSSCSYLIQSLLHVSLIPLVSVVVLVVAAAIALASAPAAARVPAPVSITSSTRSAPSGFRDRRSLNFSPIASSLDCVIDRPYLPNT